MKRKNAPAEAPPEHGRGVRVRWASGLGEFRFNAVLKQGGKRKNCGTFDNNDEAVRAIEFERCKRPVRSLSTTWSLKTFSCSKCRKQILGEPFKMQRETKNRLGQVGALFCSKTCRKQFYDSRAKKPNKKGQSDNTKSRYTAKRVIKSATKHPYMTEVQRAIMEQMLSNRISTARAETLLLGNGFNVQRTKTTFSCYKALNKLPKLNHGKKLDKVSSPSSQVPAVNILRFQASNPAKSAFDHCVALSNLIGKAGISAISQKIRSVFAPSQTAPMHEDGRVAVRKWKQSQYWMTRNVEQDDCTIGISMKELLGKVQPLATAFIKRRAGGVLLPLYVEQAFSSSYFPTEENTSGLGWHVDDGRCTAVVQLSSPEDSEPHGGGLFISSIDGLPAEVPKTEEGGGTDLRLQPGGIALFDRQVCHRAAHVLAGERWVAVFVFALAIPGLL